MGERGFTLLELVVAVGIVMVLTATSVPMLLKHIKRAGASTIVENIRSVRTAFDSYVVSFGGPPQDTDGDNDYLDELIQAGTLADEPSYPPCAVWYVKKTTDAQGHEAYYVDMDISGCSEEYEKILQELDNEVDDGDPSGGSIRYM